MFRKKDPIQEKITQTIRAVAQSLKSSPATCLGPLYIELSLEKLDRLSHHSDWIRGISSLLTEIGINPAQYSVASATRLINQLNALLARVYIAHGPAFLLSAFDTWSSVKPGVVGADDNYLVVKTLWDIKNIDGFVIKDKDKMIAAHRDAGLRKSHPELKRFIQRKEIEEILDSQQTIISEEKEEPAESYLHGSFLSTAASMASTLFGAGKNLYHWIRENPKSTLLLFVVFNDMFFLNKVAAAQVNGSTASIMTSMPSSFQLDEKGMVASATVSQGYDQSFYQRNLPLPLLLTDEAGLSESNEASVGYFRRR